MTELEHWQGALVRARHMKRKAWTVLKKSRQELADQRDRNRVDQRLVLTVMKLDGNHQEWLSQERQAKDMIRKHTQET